MLVRTAIVRVVGAQKARMGQGDESCMSLFHAPHGFEALMEWTGDSVDLVVYESTGACHGESEQALLKAGLPVAKVNLRHAL